MTAATLTASSQRPLRLRMRADLTVKRERWQGREYWIVKDPLTLKYFRFEEEEFALLEMLDGQASVEDVREQFERRFAPQRITSAELQHLLVNLHRSNLIIADSADQGRQLLTRSQQRSRKAWLAALSNVLAMRFRGFDPDCLLTWLNRRCGWFFSIPSAMCCLVLILAALALLAAEFEVVLARLPSFQAFFAMQNWLLLAATVTATKVLHEFGHGLACKRFGGECHEMGVMLLVGTPCLYCNVSDSWMIPSKWKRAAIGAAGMYVELVLAAICTFLWWFSQPGLLNHVCLNVMFVSSISTLLFNSNPLLKYDGYFILSDLLEVPNLRQKATAVVQRKLGSWILGLQERRDPFLPVRRRWLFGLYSVASSVYGWLVSLSIFWFVYRVLEPYGLKILGQLLAASMIMSLIILPVVRFGRFVFQPAGARNMNQARAAVGLCCVGAGLVAILSVPLPYYIGCSVEMQPRGATSVYVDVPGHISKIHFRAGPIAAGQPIVDLDDIDSRVAEQRLAGQRADLVARTESIRQRAHTDDSALLELAQTEEALAALDAQLLSCRQRLGRLKICAPLEGTLVPPPVRPEERTTTTQLAAWHGRPLEVRNVGAYLEASTLLGRIVRPGQLEAVLVIPQEEMDFVHAGQHVDLFLDQMPGERHSGRIEHIAEQDMKAASSRLAAGSGRLATRTGADGVERPIGVVYQASVPIEDPSGRILVGAAGRAKIYAGRQSLAARLWRSLCRTFRFEL